MDEEDAESLYEVEAARRRASAIRDHYDMEEYEEDGLQNMPPKVQCASSRRAHPLGETPKELCARWMNKRPYSLDI
jgi:hypothetical protein